jgi:NAD(P)-dependent dehydrogenase (short-subunit alcohol dehydrogenase family)
MTLPDFPEASSTGKDHHAPRGPASRRHGSRRSPGPGDRRDVRRRGADVAGLDLDAAGLDATGELVRAQGRRWTSAAVDLTDFDAVQEAVGKVVAEWGGVDVLLNGAGGGTVSPFHETTYATWTTQMDRNLNSVFNVTRAVPRRCSTSTTAGSSTSPRSRQ